MLTNRRGLFRLAGGALLASALPIPAWAAAPAGRLYLSGKSTAARQHYFSAFDSQGERLFEIDLPGRGHGLTLRPGGGQAVGVARRPDAFAVVIDLASGQAATWLDAPEGRHFHGHAVFSADGTRLFTSENDFDGSRGVIGVWDAADAYRRIGEFSSHGIEPHDIRLMPDGVTLVVANGGIATHPDSGRAKLNMDSMESSLAYIDSRDGTLRSQWRLPADLRLLSLRHLAVAADGTVAVAMQHQGPEAEIVPLVGLHDGASAIRLLAAPETVAGRMRNYCGSIALDRSGRLAAASCPRGNFVTFWDVVDGTFLGDVRVQDGCGVAAGAAAGEIVMTSGMGGVWSSAAADTPAPLPGSFVQSGHWDNHLVT